MTTFIPWNSQPLSEWTEKFAAGQIIEVDGKPTHYIEAGEGDPIILLHGFLLDSYTWAKNMDVLSIGEFLMRLNTDAVRKKNLADLWIHDMENVSDQDFENLVRFQKIEGSNEVILSILRKQFFNTLGDEFNQLAKLDIPALIVWGGDEANIPLERGQEMHQILQGSRLEIIKGAGHMPNFEKPEVFNELAIDFLQV